MNVLKESYHRHQNYNQQLTAIDEIADGHMGLLEHHPLMEAMVEGAPHQPWHTLVTTPLCLDLVPVHHQLEKM